VTGVSFAEMHAHGKSYTGIGSLLYQDWRSFAISRSIFPIAESGQEPAERSKARSARRSEWRAEEAQPHCAGAVCSRVDRSE